MRRVFLIFAMLLTIGAASGPATAQSGQILQAWTLDDMRGALTELGASVTGDGQANTGTTYLTATSTNGLRFTVYGTACENPGPQQSCRGAELTASFTLDNDQAVNDALRRIDYAAVSYFNAGDNTLRVTRYVIFDHGIARENMLVNLSVFISVAEAIWGQLG